MDSFHFENEMLPIFLQRESFVGHVMHSEMSHWHDHIEIVVVDKGTVSCKATGASFPLYKGDVCFINRRQLHQIESVKEDGAYTVMIIGTALLSQNSLVYEKFIRPILEDGCFSHIRFEGNDSPAARITELVTRASAVDIEKVPGYEMDLIAIVHLILRQIYLAYISVPRIQIPNVNAQIQQRMAEYIYGHYAETLSLDDISAAGRVSRSQCSKLFKQYTGLSPISFLNKHRLELSREALRSTLDPISVIALNCGFSDQSYYNRLFVREYGITPMTYRKGLSAYAQEHTFHEG